MFELSLPLPNPHTDRLNIHVLYSFYCIVDETSLEKNAPIYHSHDFLELTILLEGSITYKINEEVCTAHLGDIIIVNPNIQHMKLLTPASRCKVLHIGIENVYFGKNFYSTILQKHNVPVLSLEYCYEEFFAVCNQLVNEHNNQAYGYQIFMKSLVTQMLLLLCRELENNPKHEITSTYTVPNTEKHLVVETIIEYMHSHYTEDISLELISKNMFLSSVYISKIFKELTGDSPIHYLIKIRLEKAYEMLLTQNISIKEAASKVGYKDVYYFSKLFKKHYGIPPSKISHLVS